MHQRIVQCTCTFRAGRWMCAAAATAGDCAAATSLLATLGQGALLSPGGNADCGSSVPSKLATVPLGKTAMVTAAPPLHKGLLAPAATELLPAACDDACATSRLTHGRPDPDFIDATSLLWRIAPPATDSASAVIPRDGGTPPPLLPLMLWPLPPLLLPPLLLSSLGLPLLLFPRKAARQASVSRPMGPMSGVTTCSRPLYIQGSFQEHPLLSPML